MKKIIYLLIVLLLMPVSLAQTGHMYLLAVSGPDNNIGSIADLYLTIEPGQGRVFLDTFPLTQIDTQMSTRMAKQIACDFLEKDCSNKDFFYTIRAKSAIIGGPSAGSALSALTVAMLEGIEVNESVVVTGSINSGGIIGPVGGIESKIEAAQKHNFSKILIPNTDFHPENKTNKSANITINIVEVSNLAEVVYELTGKVYEKEDVVLEIDSSYERIMKDVAVLMCDHTVSLKEEVIFKGKEENDSLEIISNLTKDAERLMNLSYYYPAASYCFRANVELRVLLNKNIEEKQALRDFNDLRSSISSFEESINQKEIKTVSDLQTKIIVKERLMDAKTIIKEGIDNLGNDSSEDLSYAQERFFSAVAWSNFFDMGGKDIAINKDVLMASCMNKISEAEERYQYVEAIIDFKGNSTREEILQAREYLNDEEYEMCLFKASKAKSDLDITLTVIGITEEGLDALIEEKLKVAKEQIYREINRGFFPIMGYSYYLYSIELKDSEPLSSLIYAELSMELSNMRPYFEQPSEVKEDNNSILFAWSYKWFFIGFVSGVFVLGMFLFIFQKIFFGKKTKTNKNKQR